MALRDKREMAISTTTSAEKGREVMEPYIGVLRRLVETLKGVDLEELLPKPHK